MLYKGRRLCYVCRTSQEKTAMPKEKFFGKKPIERVPRKEPYTSDRLRGESWNGCE